MTTLIAERRPGSRLHGSGEEGRQESLFGGEALAPARPPTPVPWEARIAPQRAVEPQQAPEDPDSTPPAPPRLVGPPHATTALGSAPPAPHAHEPAATALEPAPHTPELAATALEPAPHMPELAATALEPAPHTPELAATALEPAPHMPELAATALEPAPHAPESVPTAREPEAHVAPALAPSVTGAPLARPTLDDAVSRAWEGLLTGLPAACSVCGDELRPSLGGPVQGSCGSCGASID